MSAAQHTSAALHIKAAQLTTLPDAVRRSSDCRTS